MDDHEEVKDQIKKKKSFLCVGLDTDLEKIPPHLLEDEDPIFAFNKAIIDVGSFEKIGWIYLSPNTNIKINTRSITSLVKLSQGVNFKASPKQPQSFTLSKYAE